MKRITFLIAALAAVLLSCNHVENTGMVSLVDQFANPGKEYRPAPLWVWNTDMQTGDIDRMLADFKEQGFGGAFVHPRPGLETEYLSQEWFDLWRYSVEKGKELGLDIWIYDENSYPSGFAGGHVPHEMPESYNQGRVLVSSVRDTVPDSCFLCLLRTGDNFTDITASLSEYQGKAGQYYVYEMGYPKAAAWTGGFPYVDLMVKGVTEKFIEVTMEGYEKTFGEELGPVVKGIFTDEPNINPDVPGGRRWTPDLFSTFEKMWGYDLRTQWPLLDEKIGDWKKLRHDYYATLLHLFINRWCKPWYNYTESKGLQWTGHYWEHAWPDLHEGPDNMAMYAWHQMPAIDMLFNDFNDQSCTAQFGNVRAVKELRSVANQMGRKRTLSETYGGAGANLRFVDMKRLGDWEYALGVNFMNQHLSHTSITGVRKYDYPPEFTAISPWWEDYHVLNDYFARLSLVLSHGTQKNDWLVLEPTTTLWLYGVGDDLYTVGNEFQSLLTALEKNLVEYDLGSEDIIREHGSVSGNLFRVGQCAYSTVVLPPRMENLECGTFLLLEEFAKNGGRILAMSKPSLIDGKPSDETLDVTPVTIEELLSLYEAPLKIKTDGELYHQHRTYADGELYFFANPSLDTPSKFSFESPSRLYRFDAMTGEIFAVSPKVDITLPEAGSALYFVSDAVLPCESESSFPSLADTLNCGDVAISRRFPNALSLDFCNLTVDEDQTNNLYIKEANNRLWAHFGRRDPWESAVQFRREIIESDTLPYSNIMAEYYFNVEGNVDTSTFRIIVERPGIWNVAINGRPLSADQDTLLDSRNGVYDISRAVYRGRNCVTLQLDRMNIHAELAPVIVLGNFDVSPIARGWRVTPPKAVSFGDMAQQGSPEYPWMVSYTKSLDLQELSGLYFVQLGRWEGSDAHVVVNGKKAGNISFPPYRLDITPLLQEGGNTICVNVAGSLRNLYGPHFNSDLTITHPGSWDGQYKPCSGEDYFLLPYGLEEDYSIIRFKK